MYVPDDFLVYDTNQRRAGFWRGLVNVDGIYALVGFSISRIQRVLYDTSCASEKINDIHLAV